MVVIRRDFTPPPHKTPPDVWDDSMEVGPGPYTRQAPLERIMPRTFPQAYTTHYRASPTHAHYSLLGRNWRDSRQRGITWNCSLNYSLGERRHNRRFSSDTPDKGVAHLPRAGIRPMEHGPLRILRAFCLLRHQRRR